MHLDVILIPAELAARPRPQTIAVVVDVIRATSSIVSAFEAGCRSIVPAESADEARRLQAADPGPLLCGERGGKRIAGFALGNSPREFIPDVVAGRDLILATSNGTRTLRLVGPGRAVAIAALLNRTAVADWLVAHGEDAFVICSGYEGAFSLEDAVCAGGIAERAAERGVELGDGARACRLLWARHAGELPALLRSTGWGRHIVEIGLAADLDFSARLDTTQVVPVLREGRITAEAPRR